MLYSLAGSLCGVVILVFGTWKTRLWQTRHKPSIRLSSRQWQDKSKIRKENPCATSSKSPLSDPEQVRKLYHWLHNIEDYPEVIPIAKETLLQALDTVDWHGRAESYTDGIYSLHEYTPEVFRKWIDGQDFHVMKEFEAYSLRRSVGGPRELLPDREQAIRWLRAHAPLRYVDGAWLGNLSRVDVPWAHIDVIQRLWQILSEELGDGDVQKHHTHLYAELLLSLAPDMPDAHSAEFLDKRHGAIDESIWRSAVLQMMISLFHQNLLPELLGFNLHFEAVTLGMLKAMAEMQELALDPTYFALHVCIDNAATGHTAVAMNAVCTYLEQIREQQGASAEKQAWERIQAGYALSDGTWNEKSPRNIGTIEVLEQAVADIMESKVKAGSGVHCLCKARIKGLRVVDWLDRDLIGNKAWWRTLTQALGTSRAWILPGQSERSRFLKEISWGGRMFGAFTEFECRTLREWADRLPLETTLSFGKISTPDELLRARNTADGCLKPYVDTAVALGVLHEYRAMVSTTPSRPLPINFEYNIEISILECSRWLPGIWFSQFCLLEKFVALPSRSYEPVGGLVLRILRAQYGFEDTPYHTARQDTTDHGIGRSESNLIFHLGFQMMKFYGLPQPASLPDLLSLYPCGDLPQIMSCVSAAPVKCQGLLLGMAAAFVSLHRAIAASSILDPNSRSRLRRMAETEQTELWSAMLMLDHDSRLVFASGFGFVKSQLENLLTDTGRR